MLKETDREEFSDVHAREEAFFPGSENSLSYYRRFDTTVISEDEILY